MNENMNKEIIEKYIRIAIEEAKKSKEKGENPFGVVLLDSEYNFTPQDERKVGEKYE